MEKSISPIPNIISLLRIAGSIVLLFVEPFSALFFVIYLLCGLSDILDGRLARKLNAVSKRGQIIDSLADLVFTVALLYVVLTYFSVSKSVMSWVVAIACFKLISICIGYIKFKVFSSIHTFANKVTGVLLFCFPIFCFIFHQVNLPALILCSVATLAAIEELSIILFLKVLNRDTVSLYSLLT